MTRAALLALAGAQRTLADVTRACGQHRFTLVDVVTQDEFTHDVVIAAGSLFLVYDTT
jgi:hypothetical protein